MHVFYSSAALNFLLLTFFTVQLHAQRPGISKRHFTEVIPFEYEDGKIIITAYLNDSPVPRRWILDTGAWNLLKTQTAENAGIRVHSNWFNIPKIRIGKLEFYNTYAEINELNSSPALACAFANLDGIIGANLMQLAHWQIDFERREILISDSPILPPLATYSYTLPFKPDSKRRPFVMLDIEGARLSPRMLLDTGSSGYISPDKDFFPYMSENLSQSKSITKSGVLGANVKGQINGKAHLMKVSQVSMGDLELSEVILDFSHHLSTIGTEFLEHFVMTINWKQKTIILSCDTPPSPKSTLETYGFSYLIQNRKVIVSTLYEQSPAYRAGLRLHDQIIQVNGEHLANLTAKDCERIDLLNNLGPKIVMLVLRAGRIQKIELQRVNLFD